MKINDGYHNVIIPTAAENWHQVMCPKQQAVAQRAWSDFLSWVRAQGEDELPVSFMDRRMLKMLDEMLGERIAYPASIAFALCVHDTMPDTAPGRLAVSRLVHAQGVLDLFRECLALQKLTGEDTGYSGRPVEGRPGPPRNPWEKSHELESASARWRFAQEQMRMIGFMR